MGLFQKFSAVGGWTLASRVLGFVRDKIFAHMIGASAVSDAFFVAFRIPNLFRRFLAEGAFNAAFIPMYTERAQGEDKGEDFAQTAFAGLMWIALALIAIVMIATPLFVLMLAAPFQGSERFDLAVNYTRIMIFYIGFMSLSALCAGVLNANQKFNIAAAAPLILNIVFIIAFGIVALFDIQDIGTFISYSVLVGGALQLALVYFGVRQLGIRLRPALPRWNADLRNIFAVAIPAALVNSTVQINLVVGSQIMASTDKATSWLYYADRIYQLPLGMIGVAVGVVLLPTLAGLLKSDKPAEARGAYNQGMNFAMLITIPAACAIVAIALPILRTVFEGGAFTQNDAIETAKALSIYGLGLPAFVLIKLLQPIFYAVGNTKTPMRHSLVNVALHAVLAFGLYPFFGFLSAAWAITISSWAMVGGLWISAHKRGDTAHLHKDTIKNLFIYTGMGLMMAIGVRVMCDQFSFIFDDAWLKWPFFFVVVGIGMAIYFVGVMMLAGIRPRDLKSMMRR